ncbi:MAG: hypothetical protein KDK07_20825 [Bauldia sp.]|nr:hypothetical protein [Bauldia sp.]
MSGSGLGSGLRRNAERSGDGEDLRAGGSAGLRRAGGGEASRREGAIGGGIGRHDPRILPGGSGRQREIGSAVLKGLTGGVDHATPAAGTERLATPLARKRVVTPGQVRAREWQICSVLCRHGVDPSFATAPSFHHLEAGE